MDASVSVKIAEAAEMDEEQQSRRACARRLLQRLRARLRAISSGAPPLLFRPVRVEPATRHSVRTQFGTLSAWRRPCWSRVSDQLERAAE